MKKRGFTIAELMIALVVMAIIMISIGNVTTMMVRQDLQSAVKSEVAGDTVVALDLMQRDIEYATYLSLTSIYPGKPAPGNAFGVCGDWSSDRTGPATGAQYDSLAKSSYTIYCVTGNQFASLYRYNNTIANCNAFPTIGVCGANDSNGTTPTVIVLGNGTTTGVSRGDCCEGAPNDYYFKQSNDANGIEIHYVVGNSTPVAGAVKAGQYVPTYYKIDTKVDMNRSYNNGGG